MRQHPAHKPAHGAVRLLTGIPLFSRWPQSARTQRPYSLAATEEQEASINPLLPVQGLYLFLTFFGNLESALSRNYVSKREINLEIEYGGPFVLNSIVCC